MALGIVTGTRHLWRSRLFQLQRSLQTGDRRAKRNNAAKFLPTPAPDLSLPEFQAAAKLRQEGKLVEARNALITFIQKYPNGQHFEEAKDLLGAINIDILFSPVPSPEKKEYIVKKGDVIARVAQKMKTTPELIMRTNNMNSTMLRIGERLLISNPDFSMFIQTKQKLIVLINHGQFFKQYHVQEVKLPPKQPPRINTKVAEDFGVEKWQTGRVRQP